MNKPKRLVIKIGTSTLSAGERGLSEQYMRRLVETISTLHQQGYEIVLVSSGAKGASQTFLDDRILHERGVSAWQVMAAVGQVYLMKLYWELFQSQGITVAQALLTRDDFHNHKRYLNLRNTVQRLIHEHIIPIINENDVVVTEEVEGSTIGDNDSLSALLASAIDADTLIILSDISGLYTANPKKDPNAKLIRTVPIIDETITHLVDDDKSKRFAWGGMHSKLRAAKLATSHGVTCVIASGEDPTLLLSLAAEDPKAIATHFLPTGSAKGLRKTWIAQGAPAHRNKIIIDENAEKALLANKSLLPIGITTAEGNGERGDAVSIHTADGRLIAKGLLEYSLRDVQQIMGIHSSEIVEHLGVYYGDEVVHRDNLSLVST